MISIRQAYRCSRCWESQLLVHNIILPEGNDKEHAKEASAEEESNKSTSVLLWFRRQQMKSVHGGYSADSKNSQPTCSRRGTTNISVRLWRLMDTITFVRYSSPWGQSGLRVSDQGVQTREALSRWV